MSVVPSVPQPTEQSIESDSEDRLSIDLLDKLCQQISQEQLHAAQAPDQRLAQGAVNQAQVNTIFDQLLQAADQPDGCSSLPVATPPTAIPPTIAPSASTPSAIAQEAVLSSLRHRLAALPSSPPLPTNAAAGNAGLRALVAQFDPTDLGGVIHELFGKLDLIDENRQLLNTLQDINRLFEGHIAERLAELDDANTKLRQLNHQKDHLLGMVAHDLRGPLGNIKFAVDLLKTLQPTQDEYTHFLQMIEETTVSALYLTDDLLDAAAIEAGQLTINRQISDLRPFVARVSSSNSHTSTEKQIALVIEIEPTLEQVLIDGVRMEQVLGNLLSNAFKYSYPTTTVTLTFGRNGQDLIISVADQGQGIPADEIDRLFGLFARASVRPTGQEKSTGLGLAICKRIVELHGGTIGVESTVGQGTTFTIVLPNAVLTKQQAAVDSEPLLIAGAADERRSQGALHGRQRKPRVMSRRRGSKAKGQHWTTAHATATPTPQMAG